MCGIIGFNWEDKTLLNKILKKIEHRGPDDSGKFIDKNISLGHRRLSILDLSKKGKQPMSNENGTIWIVFNGEIYNFQELRQELKQKNHEFKSNTDTEVLIHLYEEQGVECLKKLNGMFAFCIYDTRKKILFLARDRSGIKPIYYWNDKNKFMFCSEIKGILENKTIKPEINLESISSFFTFRANITEETCFKNIKKLMPGHYLIYSLKHKKIFKIEKYWNINFKEENIKNPTKKLKKLLFDSIQRRLMSDVPYGAYLSGGIDSGTIVSIMNNFCKNPIKTFSVGFENEYDEVNEAKFLSKTFQTNHHELLIKEDSVKYLPEIIYQSDEPMADPTSIPIYLLSKYAKKYCTVILTGEGSDEIFSGYPQYKFMKLHKYFMRPIPKSLRKITPYMIKQTPKLLLNKGFKFASELGEKGIERFSNFTITNDYSKQYLNIVSIFNEQEKKELFKKNYNQNLYKQYAKNFKNSRLINSCSVFDFKGNMVDDLLMKVDKNTMAFSIEGRVPFLDYRIIELASKLPENLKLKYFTKDKFILRESIKKIIPEQTRKRQKKHFFVPIHSWFKNELLQLKQDLLAKKYIEKQGIFDYDYISKINKNYKPSPLFYSRQLWALLTFQIWYKQYIENERFKNLSII